MEIEFVNLTTAIKRKSERERLFKR